ncbi:MAG: hypothetical protein AAGB26_16350 [Planctomycetota bacterium]
MQQAAFGGTPFSAEVDLWLECDSHPDRVVPLRQAGVDFIAAADPVELPAGSGWVVVSVDGEHYRNRVYLVNGMNTTHRKTEIVCFKDEVPF